jgi:hypothetical protein
MAIANRSALGPPVGHALAAEIEHVIDQWSSPLSADLEALFESADGAAPSPPQAMVSYLERRFDPDDVYNNRRAARRALLLATVTAIPLTPKLKPCGEAFKAIARDVSEGGLSLLHTRAVSAKRLALRWQRLTSPRRLISVVLEVKRCHPMGPFYLLAGQFVKNEPSSD